MNRNFYGNNRGRSQVRSRSRSLSRGPVGPAATFAPRRARSLSVQRRPVQSEPRRPVQWRSHSLDSYRNAMPAATTSGINGNTVDTLPISETNNGRTALVCDAIQEERSIAETPLAPKPTPARLALPEHPHTQMKMEIPREILTGSVPQMAQEITIPMNAFIGPVRAEQDVKIKEQTELAKIGEEKDEATTISVVPLSSPAHVCEVKTNDEITVMRTPSLSSVPVPSMYPKLDPFQVTRSNAPTLSSLVPKSDVPRNSKSSFPLLQPLANFAKTLFEGERPRFKIGVQLAHGSPTRVIDGMSIDELYQKIAASFDLKLDDIIFCTVNTYKNDMDKLFVGQLTEDDLLFVHVRGQPVEISLEKSEGCLGLSISDNGNGRSFVKRVKQGSICARAMPAICCGQQIEKINGECMLNKRHFEVARILRHLPIGESFTMRLVCPVQSGFSMLRPRGATGTKGIVDNGLKTLRFKSNGQMVVEEKPMDGELLKKLDVVLDEYLGVQDEQLAHSLLEVVVSCKTLQELGDVIKQSDLQMFDFPDELIFDVWGIVGDWKKKQEITQ